MPNFEHNLGNCFYHPEREAWGICDLCDHSICLEDKNVDDLRGRTICDNCLDENPKLAEEEDEEVESFELCYYHPEVLASSNCANCKKPICPDSEYPYMNDKYLCIMCKDNFTPEDLPKERTGNFLVSIIIFSVTFVAILIVFFLL